LLDEVRDFLLFSPSLLWLSIGAILIEVLLIASLVVTVLFLVVLLGEVGIVVLFYHFEAPLGSLLLVLAIALSELRVSVLAAELIKLLVVSLGESLLLEGLGPGLVRRA
jgi:hypothetical protein